MIQPELHEYVSQETYDQGNNQSKMTSTRMSIDELMLLDLPETKWLIPGKISIGLTNISGRPKVGKSFFSLQLAIAKATGGYFLGEKLERGRVLYIDLENSKVRMQERVRRMGIPKKADLDIEFSWPQLDKGGLEKLEEDIENEKWDLIIIDTLSRALSINAKQNDMGPMNDIVGKLQNLAISHGMSIIVIDHQRKGNGSPNDPVDDILGSTGKSAPLDTILSLNKQGGKVTLRMVGRDIGDQEITLQWNAETFTWSISDNKQQQGHSRKDREIGAINELLDKGELPTTTNVANYLVLDKGNVSSDFSEMVAEGRIVPWEKQGSKKPYYPVDRQPSIAITAE